MRARSVIGIAVSLLLTVFPLTACARSAGSVSAPVDNQSPLTLRITWKAYSGRGEAIRKIADAYSVEKPGAPSIVLQDGDEDLDAILKDLETGTSDVLVLPYRYVQYLGDKGALQDLTADMHGSQEAFEPALWSLGTVEGKVYGVPWLGHAMALLFNRNLLTEAGVQGDSIRSMSELLRAMEQVEARTDSQGIGLVGADHNDISWMVNQFIYGFGGKLVNDDGRTVAVNSLSAADAIRFYKEVLGSHSQKTWLTDTGVEVMTHFRNQEVAFEIQGPWGVTDLWKNGNPFAVGVLPLERIGLKAEVGPMMLAVPAALPADKREAVLDFIRYLTSKSAQERIMDGEYSPEHDAYYPFRVPVRKDIGTALVFQKYPEFIPFIEGFKKPSIDVPVPKWQDIKTRYYAPGLSRVMAGEMAVEAFLEQIEAEGNRILGSD